MKRVSILLVATAMVGALVAMPSTAAAKGKPVFTEDQKCADKDDSTWTKAEDGGPLVLSADDPWACADIDGASNDTDQPTFTFTFAVTPTDGQLTTSFVLGVRNSMPGDWCGGEWTLYDNDGNVLLNDKTPANVLLVTSIGDGWTAALQLDEVIVDGNCTTAGAGENAQPTVEGADSDPGWVITLMDQSKKRTSPVTGETIAVTWTRED